MLPGAIELGYIFLILPGLVLTFAPTVFLYTATFALVRRLLPIPRGSVLNVSAACSSLGLAILVTLPMAATDWLAFRMTASGDVAPHDRVVIRGDVLLDDDRTDTERVAGKLQVRCGPLCAALLDTPGVGTVTIAHKDHPISYRLVPKGAGTSTGTTPKRPEDIVEDLPEKPVSGDGRNPLADFAARKAQENTIIAHWGLRLANDVTLAVVPSPAHHDLTITLRSTVERYRYVLQVDVRDRAGHVLLRRQHVRAERVLVPPLLVHDTFHSNTWRLARTGIETSAPVSSLEVARPIRVLFEETTLARPSEPSAVVTSMRDRLAAALMQPGASTDLALADPWVATIDPLSVADDDLELLGKVIVDARVIELPQLCHAAGQKTVRAKLRGPIVAKLLNPATSPQLRDCLDGLVRGMPPGTFAVSTPDEVAMLHDQLLRLRAPGLVLRLADQGKAGVPELVRILQEDAHVDSRLTRRELTAVRRALAWLGPDAAGALPAVIALFDQPSTPLADHSGEMDGWRIAMVRMGRPVEDVPFPPSSTAEQSVQHLTHLKQAVERVDKLDDSGF